MSISSEIARISGEVNTQSDLLDQAIQVLAGKAAGGSGGASTVIITITSGTTNVMYTGEHTVGSLAMIDFGGAKYNLLGLQIINILEDGTDIYGAWAQSLIAKATSYPVTSSVGNWDNSASGVYGLSFIVPNKDTTINLILD